MRTVIKKKKKLRGICSAQREARGEEVEGAEMEMSFDHGVERRTKSGKQCMPALWGQTRVPTPRALSDSWLEQNWGTNCALLC